MFRGQSDGSPISSRRDILLRSHVTLSFVVEAGQESGMRRWCWRCSVSSSSSWHGDVCVTCRSRLMSIFERLANQRIWPLFVKELRQIGRNRRLGVSLIIPPTLTIIFFGFALNPEFTNLRLGVVDSSRTAVSRELVSAFVESRAFDITA